MSIRTEFDFKIEEDEIIRLFGYKDCEPSQEILDSVKEEVMNCKIYIKPQIWSEKIKIRSIEKERVILDNSIVFEGEFIANKLKNCSYIIVLVSTIGVEIDKIIQSSFDDGDYLKGMIVDNIGTTSMGYIDKMFWSSLLDNLKGTNIGITQRLSPGDATWYLDEQKKIFECFKNTKLNVELLESCLMVPIKSTTAIFGFGEGIGICKLEHICTECNMKNCIYRMNKNIEVKIKTDNKITSIKAFKGQNLLKALVENNISIQHPCNGKATCGKCKVLITGGTQKTSKEDIAHLNPQEIEKGIHLACSYRIVNDIEVTLISKEDNIDVLTVGQEISVTVKPSFRKEFFKLEVPSINDQRDDVHRLKDALQLKEICISNKILCNLSEIIRKDEFKVTACIYKNTLVTLESGDTSNVLYGIAVDIGTTTIACYLVDMISGRTVDTASHVNNQGAYGADVISRISYTIENLNGVQVLKSLIVNQINGMVESLCLNNNLVKDYIYNMTIAGNTVMIHMFLGISCKNISMAPYIPVFTENIDFNGEEIGINIGGIVSILPGISSYVGSDITAGILASGMTESKNYSILLDLGTNGELALGNNSGIVACSTAAGPAFEGANIKYGIGGVKGAVSKVDLSKQKIYKTIGDELPVGICGSGVLDAVSELLKYEIVDETGRMVDAEEILDINLSERIVTIEGMKQFLIEDNGKNNSIYFTQKDVREVQLAKAAISAGIKILIAERGISYKEIEKIYVAGGFGNFMDIKSTINIGMLPKELEDKVYSIGNSAGSGAKIYLLSQEQREKALQIKETTTYVELSNRQDFQECFMDSIMF
ncbi:ASKHA domain-containing protein [Clostridium sp.]|uniref:ASKHA domain-containing protein n=1 Tax=Clostridium sp. TaxID=1506 RepID=UPI0025C72FE2|nr:ASKHA domain-containing protein [Clostridium sp.]